MGTGPGAGWLSRRGFNGVEIGLGYTMQDSNGPEECWTGVDTLTGAARTRFRR
jgi:hypothetical protein